MGEVIAFLAGAVIGVIITAVASINRKTESEDDEQMRRIREMIRKQSEYIRETPEEYIMRKYGIGDDVLDKGNATELPEQKG